MAVVAVIAVFISLPQFAAMALIARRAPIGFGAILCWWTTVGAVAAILGEITVLPSLAWLGAAAASPAVVLLVGAVVASIVAPTLRSIINRSHHPR